jgi:hypothetical protein
MNFCPDCENNLNTKILSDDNSNKIRSFVCNNCSYKKIIDTSKEPEYKCVYKQNYNIKKIDIGQFNDKYLSKDPTLPHVDNIPCPNLECITNKINPNSEILDIGAPKENINNVLYKKINESDLTFKYQCCNCKHTWTNK